MLVDTPFATETAALASSEGYVDALNGAYGDAYTQATPQWTAQGVAPQRWAVLFGDDIPPGVAVPQGALLEEIGDAWYEPPS